MTDTTHATFRPAELADFLFRVITKATGLRRLVPMIWGEPGIGKTDIVKQTAERAAEHHKMEFAGDWLSHMANGGDHENVYGVIDMRTADKESIDLRGLPQIVKAIAGEGDQVSYAAPVYLPRVGQGVFLLDEAFQGPQGTVHCATQIMRDNRVGEHVIPDGWRVIAASNKASHRAGANRPMTHTASSLIHVEMAPDHNDWLRWALQAGVRHECISYIRSAPQDLHKFDPKDTDHTFPCPRTWAMVSDILDCEPPAETHLIEFGGTIGVGVGANFAAHVGMIATLPDLDGILLNPDTADIPEEPSAMFAVATGLARKANAGNFDRVITYTDRLANHPKGGRDFQVLTVRDACALAKAEVMDTSAFQKWAIDNSDIVI